MTVPTQQSIKLTLPSGRVVTILINAPGDPVWAELQAIVANASLSLTPAP